jgi:DMSO reductase anchor subunit
LLAASDIPGAEVASRLAPTLRATALVVGLLGVFCSVMIYVDTHRVFWRFPNSGIRMFGTVGVTAAALFDPLAGALALAARLGFEALALHGDATSARLQRGPLRSTVVARFAAGGVAIVLLATGFTMAGLAAFVLGEFAERCLYFRAVDAPRMPGVPAS